MQAEEALKPGPGLSRVLVVCTGGTITMVLVDGRLQTKMSAVHQIIRANSTVRDQSFALPDHQLQDYYFTPPSLKGERVAFKFHEMPSQIDSADASPQTWLDIATVIKDRYHDYDGFVVTHGTDTLAFSASALSFIIQNLGKPIVFTGSQVPMSYSANDAFNNLLEAIIVAGLSKLREVLVVFSHLVLRGNRIKKMSTSNLGSFASPNCLQLGTFKSRGLSLMPVLKPQCQTLTPNFYLNLQTRVLVFKIYPRASYNYLLYDIETQKARGVVIEAYGSGTLPAQLGPVLQQLRKRGVLSVVVSQVPEGQAYILYKSSEQSQKCVLCGDMTVEAAYTKLCWVLGLGLSLEEGQQLMRRAVCGQMTV